MDSEWGFGGPPANNGFFIQPRATGARRTSISSNSNGPRRGRLGIGLGLAIASQTPTPDIEFAEGAEIAAATANTNHNLSEGVTVERPGIDGSSVYYLLRGEERVGIRKFVSELSDREGHYEATQNELYVYNTITRHARASEYIVPFLRGKSTRGVVYIDFDLVPGMTFAKLEPSHTRAYPLLAKVVAALQWLTSVGYAHGDIKSDNIYVTTDGNVRLMDFGKARPMTAVAARDDRIAFVRFASAYVSPARAAALRQLERASPIGTDQTQFYANAMKIFEYTGRQTRRNKHKRGRKSRRR
jgi:serine/threonine protein kinase